VSNEDSATSETNKLDQIAIVTYFLCNFSDIPDKRQPWKVKYVLKEVLLLCLIANLAGAETPTDMARFGEKKLDLLRRFLPYENGTPPHDTIGTIFQTFDAVAFRRCFVNWMAKTLKIPGGVIAIDGKTMRRTGDKKKEQPAAHIVSAFDARKRLVLGQEKVKEKTNEIIAIPALLDLLSIEGAFVTIDAMGCQRAISEKIINKKAHFILGLKGNQGTLFEDLKLFFDEQRPVNFKDTTISTHKTVDCNHGRIETREYTVIHNIDDIQKIHKWPGLKSLIIVDSTREFGKKIEKETRFYITSSSEKADIIGPMVREHWAIENSLHWVLDMTFRDDHCRVRTNNAPENLATLNHIAYNLIRKASGKDSMRLRRKTAAWDDEYLVSILTAGAQNS
jgi:predicted transposase YbfD/YdcC